MGNVIRLVVRLISALLRYARVSFPVVPVLTVLLLALPVLAADPGTLSWTVLQSVEARDAGRSLWWRARVLEEVTTGDRPDALAGRSGDLANSNRRLLLIDVFREGGGVVRRTHVYELPSHTREDDVCDVRHVNARKNSRYLVIDVTYDFACGAGSTNTAQFTLDIRRRPPKVMRYEWTHASREIMASAQVDYSTGRIKLNRNRPEEEAPSRPTIRTTAIYPIALDRGGLMRCPRPFAGEPADRCWIDQGAR